ncbi:MAG: efflux RND transporter periplasmic adaptor subunit [Patescibacteria group bacterium]
MSKKKKIWIIIIVVLVILIVGSIILVAKNSKKIEYVTASVEKTTLKQSVDATGKIESAEKIDLNFKTAGRIAQIFVKIGDIVESGHILATLEAGALQSRVSDAIAQVSQAEADYAKILAGASSGDIKISENTTAQRQQDLISAQNNLKNLKYKKDTELLNLKETALTYLNNEIITAKIAMAEVDNTLNDKDAKDTLSVKDSSALVLAEKNKTYANNGIINSENIIKNLNISSSDTEILNGLENLQNTLNLVSTDLGNVADVLIATIISSKLSEAELDALKTNITAEQSAIKTSQINIQSAKSNWTNKVAYYSDQIEIYTDNVTGAEKALELAESQLNLKKEPPRQFEIDTALARIKQAKASLQLAQVNLSETIITAPINGTIIKKNNNVGEQSSLTNPILEMIGESNLQIEVDIPESDIAKIKIGQDADVSLDAFSDDKIFPGKVVFIDPAETIIQDVVYYKVKIQLTDSSEIMSFDIKPGMTANVVVCTDKRENVLVVPTRAVKSNNGDKYVDILVNGAIEKNIVTTGLRGDEGIEIMSGIEEGDEVVTFVKQ